MIGISLDIPEVAARASMIPPWVLPGATIDIDYANNRAWDGTAGMLVAVASLHSITRASSETYTDVNGLLSTIGSGTLATGTAGLQVFESRANVVLWNSDLTNVAWTATTATTTLDQTGPDGVTNSASSILATAGSATILQAITLVSSARFQTAYVKRLVGTGTVNMTMDNGATWTAVTVTAAWTRVSIPTQTLANPTVGFQIITNGDKIAVALVQNENGAFATPAMPTTTVSVTRAADNVAPAGNLATRLAAAAGSLYARVSMTPNPASRIVGATALNSLMGPSDNTHVGMFNGAVQIFSGFGHGSFSTTDVVVASGWDGLGRSIVANGGTVGTDANTNQITGPSIGSRAGSSLFFDGNIRRMAVWSSRLSDASLQALAP